MRVEDRRVRQKIEDVSYLQGFPRRRNLSSVIVPSLALRCRNIWQRVIPVRSA